MNAPRRPTRRQYALAREYDARVQLAEKAAELPNGKQRQRCRNCRRYFAWVVVDGHYCELECADPERAALLRAASWRVDRWNEYRRCDQCQGGGGRKRNYRSKGAATRVANRFGNRVYPCPHYRGIWHNTSQPERLNTLRSRITRLRPRVLQLQAVGYTAEAKELRSKLTIAQRMISNGRMFSAGFILDEIDPAGA